MVEVVVYWPFNSGHFLTGSIYFVIIFFAIILNFVLFGWFFYETCLLFIFDCHVSIAFICFTTLSLSLCLLLLQQHSNNTCHMIDSTEIAFWQRSSHCFLPQLFHCCIVDEASFTSIARAKHFTCPGNEQQYWASLIGCRTWLLS